MRSKNTLEYLGLWEQLNNPNFKGAEFDPLLKEAGSVGTYYNFIFRPSPLSSSYSVVNNILERGNLEETPIKWGKKRLKIFP